VGRGGGGETWARERETASVATPAHSKKRVATILATVAAASTETLTPICILTCASQQKRGRSHYPCLRQPLNSPQYFHYHRRVGGAGQRFAAFCVPLAI